MTTNRGDVKSNAKTNIKTVILSTIRVPLSAIITSLEALKGSIFEHTGAQDKALMQLQTQTAQNHETITTTYNEILKYNEEIKQVKLDQFTKEQLDDAKRRIRELNWITSQLYDIVYEIKLNGSSDKPMPDFDHPIVTRKELEKLFREDQDIEPDVELTPEQQELFENFVTQWFIDNPGHILDEDLPQS